MIEKKLNLDFLKKMLPKSKTSFLTIVGIVGMLLILVSSMADKGENKKSSQENASVTLSENEKYVDAIENQLESVISDMLGSTDVSVMITLESGSEYVYANEIKTDAGTKKDQSSLKLEQNDSNQQTFVIVKDAQGNEQPLIIKQKMPTVRGVIIVCNSGQASNVSSAIRMAVKSALNVDEDKICIIGRY